MNLIIKFECPGCGQSFDGDATSEFDKFTCPTCRHEFYPKALKAFEPANAPVAIAPETPKNQPLPEAQPKPIEDAQTELKNRRDYIHGKAYDMVTAAMMLVAVGCVAAIISIVVAVSGGSAFWGWTITSSTFGAAMWFYLVAQIIHIRANTEK